MSGFNTLVCKESGFDAFVCEEYYDAWASAEVEAGRQPTQLRFLQEFGTPYLFCSHGRKNPNSNYIPIPPGTGVRMNFNYFSDMKIRFPDTPYVDQNIKYIDDIMTPISIRMYKWISNCISKFFSNASKRSAVAPIDS
jgi:hypothetical protein